jgi:hypothetical protein
VIEPPAITPILIASMISDRLAPAAHLTAERLISRKKSSDSVRRSV